MSFVNPPGSFRLYDFEILDFLGPVETRREAERRKSRFTRRKRDDLTNWYRIRVHPVQVESDGRTLKAKWQRCVDRWRSTVLNDK